MLRIWIREAINEINHVIAKRQRRKIDKIAEIVLSNLDLVWTYEAAKTAAAFEKAHLQDVPFYKSRKSLFKACLDAAPAEGLFMELGVYKGDSINLLAKMRPSQQFFGFDSFEGLPEAWTLGARKGAFDIGGGLPSVRDNVSLIKGFFSESLGPFRNTQQGKTIAFAHIDCDLYSSTKEFFAMMQDMIVPGTVILFDEYFNYSDWEEGEYKAFQEFVTAKNIQYEYIGYIRTASQVAVRIK